MKDNPFTIQEQVVIVRRYKDISITSKLQAFHLPTAQALLPRYYNGRIAWQYKNLRVGLTTLPGNYAAALTVHLPVLSFNYYLLTVHRSVSALCPP